MTPRISNKKLPGYQLARKEPLPQNTNGFAQTTVKEHKEKPQIQSHIHAAQRPLLHRPKARADSTARHHDVPDSKTYMFPAVHGPRANWMADYHICRLSPSGRVTMANCLTFRNPMGFLFPLTSIVASFILGLIMYASHCPVFDRHRRNHISSPKHSSLNNRHCGGPPLSNPFMPETKYIWWDVMPQTDREYVYKHECQPIAEPMGPARQKWPITQTHWSRKCTQLIISFTFKSACNTCAQKEPLRAAQPLPPSQYHSR